MVVYVLVQEWEFELFGKHHAEPPENVVFPLAGMDGRLTSRTPRIHLFRPGTPKGNCFTPSMQNCYVVSYTIKPSARQGRYM